MKREEREVEVQLRERCRFVVGAWLGGRERSWDWKGQQRAYQKWDWWGQVERIAVAVGWQG